MANKLYSFGEGMSDARLADIVLQGPLPSYDQLRLMADMDSGFTLKKIEQTARNMYKSRSRAASAVSPRAPAAPSPGHTRKGLHGCLCL